MKAAAAEQSRLLARPVKEKVSSPRSRANTAVELAPEKHGKSVRIAHRGDSKLNAGLARVVECFRCAGTCRSESEGRGVVM